ncbi:MAG: hypothetical protein KC620_16300 [Myxococcales bacterium]|nr:hypothetical protein [Myxococcales bacterium]
MRRLARRLAACGLCLFMALPACGGKAVVSDEEPPVGTTGLAPVPFPAQQIREATSNGRTYRFRLDAHGQSATVRTMRFEEVDDDGATVVSSTADTQGNPIGEPKSQHATWADLESHAHYPANATHIKPASIKTDAGRFDCKLYTVRDAEGISRAWFANDLPGAPVRLEIERDGKIVLRMELIDYAAGK